MQVQAEDMADSEEIDIEMDLENMNLVDGRAAGLVEEGDVSEPPRLPQEKDQTPPRPPAEEEQVPSWMMKRLRAEELRTLRESSSGSSMKYSGYRVESSFEEGKTDTRMAFEEDCDDDSLSSDDSQGDLVCIEAHPMDEDECQSRKRPTRPIEVDALPYSDPDIEQTMPTVIEDLFDFTELMSSTFGVLRTFVTSPCPQHVVTRCYIHRTGFLHPIYALCADLEDGTGRELIACRKVRSRTAHYVFTLNEKDLFRKRPQRSSLYLGKLRVVNGDYVLYDAGCRVVQADLPSDSRLNALRTEQAVVHLNTLQRPPPAGCRSMEVCFPTPCVTPVNAPRTMHERFEQIRSSNRQNDLYASSCTVLHEKTSR